MLSAECTEQYRATDVECDPLEVHWSTRMFAVKAQCANCPGFTVCPDLVQYQPHKSRQYMARMLGTRLDAGLAHLKPSPSKPSPVNWFMTCHVSTFMGPAHLQGRELSLLCVGDGGVASDSQAGFTSPVDNVYQQSLAVDATQSLADWQVRCCCCCQTICYCCIVCSSASA